MKPTSAAGYTPEAVARVRALCVYVATILGDLADDWVLVGGLVPSLLVDQSDEPHVGTADLDLAFNVAILEEQRYTEIAERLRQAGFVPDTNPHGHPTAQRWKYPDPPVITLDFLIAPTRDTDKGGTLRNLERDFAAIITPGVHLAFQDRVRIPISGQTILGEDVHERHLSVCGPGAFVILKALAFRGRGENKDAYDLYYVLQHHPGVADALRPLLDDVLAQHAVQVLRDDFMTATSLGPMRAARFLTEGADHDIQQDAVSFVKRLLDDLGL